MPAVLRNAPLLWCWASEVAYAVECRPSSQCQALVLGQTLRFSLPCGQVRPGPHPGDSSWFSMGQLQQYVLLMLVFGHCSHM
jgi:hypothetical protein